MPSLSSGRGIVTYYVQGYLAKCLVHRMFTLRRHFSYINFNVLYIMKLKGMIFPILQMRN